MEGKRICFALVTIWGSIERTNVRTADPHARRPMSFGNKTEAWKDVPTSTGNKREKWLNASFTTSRRKYRRAVRLDSGGDQPGRSKFQCNQRRTSSPVIKWLSMKRTLVRCQSKIEMSYRRLSTDVVFLVGCESCLQR
ncbi:hypothetical protein, partial [Caballeronia arationis]